VAETVDRANLYQAQTPQCFGLRELLAGYEELVRQGRAGDLMDDAQVFERMGRRVPITAGSAVNMKITTQSDLAVARGLVGKKKGMGNWK
jgi:2-C-methyl-D-erythritol 4-phosphate cytidylyltransferase